MKKKILVILLILVFLYCIGGVVYSIFIRQIDEKSKVDKHNDNIVTIDGFEYRMNLDTVTPLFKENFLNLKENLEGENIDYNEYAISVAKLYIIDFYTLSNKINKYDIGAIQFVEKDGIDNFKLKASDTLYKYIIDNTNNDRVQELPEVSEIFNDSIETSNYIIGSNEYPSYTINLKWIYKKELGYDTEAQVVLVLKDNILSVVEERRILDEDD